MSALPVFDFATTHVYERHMELRPHPTDQPGGGDWPNWLFCGFDCYIEWWAAARAGGRPPNQLARQVRRVPPLVTGVAVAPRPPACRQPPTL